MMAAFPEYTIRVYCLMHVLGCRSSCMTTSTTLPRYSGFCGVAGLPLLLRRQQQSRRASPEGHRPMCPSHEPAASAPPLQQVEKLRLTAAVTTTTLALQGRPNRLGTPVRQPRAQAGGDRGLHAAAVVRLLSPSYLCWPPSQPSRSCAVILTWCACGACKTLSCTLLVQIHYVPLTQHAMGFQ